MLLRRQSKHYTRQAKKWCCFNTTTTNGTMPQDCTCHCSMQDHVEPMLNMSEVADLLACAHGRVCSADQENPGKTVALVCHFGHTACHLYNYPAFNMSETHAVVGRIQH